MESVQIPKKFLSCKNSSPLQLDKDDNSNSRKFYIYKSDDGYFKIRAVSSGDLLTARNNIDNQKSTKNADIFYTKHNGSDYQKWSIEGSEKGGVYIVCKGNDMILGFDNSSKKIKLCSKTKNKGEKFKLKIVKKFKSEKYTISTDKKKLQINRIKTMLKALRKNWSAERLNRIINNSSMCFGVYDESGTQVGFARVITDYMTTCFVMNVVVDKNHRGSGIGTKLMTYILEHEDLKDCQFSLVPSNRKTAKTYGLVGFKVARCKYMRAN